MAKITAEIQGMDADFRFNGSYDAIELGEVTLAEARGLMRKLPDEGGVTPEFLKGEGELCPPYLSLSFTRMVKKGLLRKKLEEEFVTLSLMGGGERGKVQVIDETARKPKFAVVSFSEADEIISHFFREASEEPADNVLGSTSKTSQHIRIEWERLAILQSFLQKLSKYVAKLPEWVIVALFLVASFAAMIFLELWSQVREAPTIGQPGTMVFETGGGSIVLTIFLTLMGLAFVCVGLWLLWILGRNFIEEVKRGVFELKESWILLVALLVFIFGAGMIYLFAWDRPRSERIVIDKASETIEMEKYYLLRHETEVITFGEISRVEYEKGTSYGGSPGSRRSYAIVTLVTSGEREIEVSRDGPRFQYRLAKAISDATGRPLMD